MFNYALDSNKINNNYTNTIYVNKKQPVLYELNNPNIIPLYNNPYPVDALPDLIRNAVQEAQGNVQAPVELVAASALAAISLACQDRIDVRRYGSLEGPTSLNLVVIGESGERKSSVSNIFMDAIEKYENEISKKSEQDMQKFDTEYSRWENELSGKVSAIKIRSKNSKPLDELNNEHDEIISRKPIMPKVPKLIMSDATIEGILDSLHSKWPSAGLITDEGSVIFDSRALSKLGNLNKLWDGKQLSLTRKKKEDSFVLRDARLTFFFMVQRDTLKNYLEKKGELSRDTGFLARCLFAYPFSTQGTRYIYNTNLPHQYIDNFGKRISEILNSEKSDSRITLEFSEEAMTILMKLNNIIEERICDGGIYSNIRDCASKIQENIARMAALFHYFEDRTGAIGVETLHRAHDICIWHLNEFNRLFSVPDTALLGMADAVLLERWLIESICPRLYGNNCIEKSYLTQRVPNQLRDKKRRDAAFLALENAGKVTIVQFPFTKTNFLFLKSPVFQIGMQGRGDPLPKHVVRFWSQVPVQNPVQNVPTIDTSNPH